MYRRLRLAAAGLTALLFAACINIYPPQAPSPAGAAAAAAQAKKEDEKEPFKKWDEVLEDTRAIDGMFKFHLKRDNTLYLELAPAQLEQDFGMVLHISKGVSHLFLEDGAPADWESRLMRFRRVGDHVQLVHRNVRFTAEPGSPLLASVNDNVGHSVAAMFRVESEHKDSKSVLVDATSFFVSDYADFAPWLRIIYGNKPVMFNKEQSHVAQVMGFPKNVEVDASLTFRASDFPAFGWEGVSDYRSVPVTVRYSLFALPEQPMQPRLGDDRVGHFLDALWDYSRDQKDSWFLPYVRRWRLAKQDPNAELSEPVKPIVYYIDRTVPLQYRKYVKEGIEAWNRAFEKAGFKNAVVAMDAPDDSAWSAEDARYSTVRWQAAPWGGAYGPSQTDPRTGEILNSDIIIFSGIMRFYNFEYQELAGPDGLIGRYEQAERALERMRTLPGRRADRLCFAQLGRAQQLAFQFASLVGLGVIDADKPVPEEFWGDALRDLIMHEVGHTLGLRHNFRGSAGTPYDKLNDQAYTAEHGLTLSVMDYGPVNVAVDPKRQGHYWNKTVGTYDQWAIQYAYAPIFEQPETGAFKSSGTLATTAEAELPGLKKLAAQAAAPLHVYGTDEDNWLGVFAVDPNTNAWDLGSDPLRYAKDRAALVARVQPTLEKRLIGEGDGWQRLRGAVNNMIFERFQSLLPVTKTVGGMHTARDHKGDPNARMPFTPVPAARQREAVKLIADEAFAEDAFRFEAETLNKLAPNRMTHWGTGFLTIPVDYPLHSQVALVQSILLGNLLALPRIARMIDNEVRMPRGSQAYTAAELFTTLTSSIWSELGEAPRRPRNINSFRRNLQRAHLGQLTNILFATAGPEDARSLARWELSQLAERMGQALAGNAPGLDTPTRAHLAESQARIERALEAAIAFPAPR